MLPSTPIDLKGLGMTSKARLQPWKHCLGVGTGEVRLENSDGYDEHIYRRTFIDHYVVSVASAVHKLSTRGLAFCQHRVLPGTGPQRRTFGRAQRRFVTSFLWDPA